MRLAAFLAPSLLLCLATAAEAADPEGRYAVDGVGASPCSRLIEALEARGPAIASFGGWIEGYVTAFNHLQPDTYDLTPWQTPELLAAKLARYCRENPTTPVVDALNLLAQTLYDGRMTEASDVVSARAGGQSVFLYEAVLVRMRARLAELGFPSDGAAAFDDALADALGRFQVARGLPVSRLPDQPTLNALWP